MVADQAVSAGRTHPRVRIMDALDAYLVERRGPLRPDTLISYRRLIQHCAEWLDPEADVEDMCGDLLHQYQAVLAQRCAPKTVTLHLTALRSFSRWCIRAGLRSDDPTLALDWPVLLKRAPRALRSHEMDHLHRTLAIEPEGDGRARRLFWRNRRAIYTMLYAGLRLTEAAQLQWADVDWTHKAIWVINGKGGKDRVVALHDALAAEYKRVPPDEQLGAICGHKGGDCLKPKSLAHLFERWLPLEVNGPRISAHRLRHSCATEMLLNGADLEAIRQVLGHESLKTTQIYLMYDPERVREAVNRIPSPPKVIRRLGRWGVGA